MTEIALFHHAGGLTPGVLAFADLLRSAGHTVHAPDLFEGRTFDDLHDGVAHADALGHEELARRAAAVAEPLPERIVYAGMSLGCAMATGLLLSRPGAIGALYLYGAVTPRWWDAEWPAGVPAQAHVAATDEWREPEIEEEFAALGDTEVFVYEADGHLFLDTDSPDYAPGAAPLATGRILAFLGQLD